VEMSQRAIWIGEFFVRRTFTVTAAKFFTPYIMCQKIASHPNVNNLSSSDLNVLDITIGWIKNHVSIKVYKWYTNCELLIFSEVIASRCFFKELEYWRSCVALCCVVSSKLKIRIFGTLAHK